MKGGFPHILIARKETLNPSLSRILEKILFGVGQILAAAAAAAPAGSIQKLLFSP